MKKAIMRIFAIILSTTLMLTGGVTAALAEWEGSESIETVDLTICAHRHDEGFGYADTAQETPCTNAHDESCGTHACSAEVQPESAKPFFQRSNTIISPCDVRTPFVTFQNIDVTEDHGMCPVITQGKLDAYAAPRLTRVSTCDFGFCKAANSTESSAKFLLSPSAGVTTATHKDAENTTADGILTDATTGVSVAGVFAKNAGLTVVENALHAEADCSACAKILARQEAGEVAAIYDIRAEGGYQGNITVSIPVDANYNEGRVTVLHCNGGELAQRRLSVEGGIASGAFASLSPVAVMRPDNAALDSTAQITIENDTAATESAALSREGVGNHTPQIIGIARSGSVLWPWVLIPAALIAWALISTIVKSRSEE